METLRHILLVALVTAAGAVRPDSATNPSEGSPDGAAEIVRRVLARGCSKNYTTTCLKLDLVSLVDKLSAKDTYEILPSVAVVRTDGSRMSEGGTDGSGNLPEELVTDLARGLQEAGDASAVARLDEFLVSRLGRYLDSHSVSVKLFETGALARKMGEEVMQRLGFQTAESGRGKGGGFGGGKKGGLGMLGAMMIMSKATIGAIALGALALLAGKALIVGLLSLLLSAIVGVKSLASKGGGGSVTYEIVQKPVYSHAHSHSHEEIHSGHGGHSGYGKRRSFEEGSSGYEDAHAIAYSSYFPQRDIGVGSEVITSSR